MTSVSLLHTRAYVMRRSTSRQALYVIFLILSIKIYHKIGVILFVYTVFPILVLTGVNGGKSFTEWPSGTRRTVSSRPEMSQYSGIGFSPCISNGSLYVLRVTSCSMSTTIPRNLRNMDLWSTTFLSGKTLPIKLDYSSPLHLNEKCYTFPFL